MLPSWVKHRDGRLAPFDADAISQNLFAAAQSLGPADAFLVRELTDGVVHFLAQEDLGDTTTSDRIDDVIEKIVRELGQPTLALAVAQRRTSSASSDILVRPPLSIPFAPTDRPDDIADRCLDAFTLRSVFAPDLAAAHEQGLIQLGGLHEPRLLDAIVLEPAALDGRDPFDAAWELVAAGAERAGQHLVLDSPEWMLPNNNPDAIASFVDGLDRAAQAHRRRINVHVNVAIPPPWAQPRGNGPLFANPSLAPASSPGSWIEPLTKSSPRVQFVWHWRNDPSIDAPFADLLAQSPHDWAVMFDRPGQPIALSHGLNRRRPGILTGVGLDLPRLLNRTDVSCQGEIFLDKLPSLARLAVSAGVQKRAYLRRHADHLSREFLLDRAAIRVELLGLSTVLQQLLGVPTPSTKLARVLVRKILSIVQSTFNDAQRRTSLEFLLAGPDAPLAIDAPDATEALLALDEFAPAAIVQIQKAAESQAQLVALLESASRQTELAGIHATE